MATLDATAGDGRMQGETLRMEWPAPHVALVTFDRADELNSLSLAMISELDQALAIAEQRRPAAVILTGTGRAFCAGADLKLLTSPDAEFFRSPMAFRDQYLAPLARLFDSMEEMPFPIVAAINGYALGGGCEMALSADFRIISRTAIIGMPEVHLGATPGAGGVQKLIRHVGRSKALEWILLGSRISAEEAERRGLVVEVTEPEQLLDRALELAGRLEKASSLAIAQAKASIYLAEDADLRTARRFGVEALTALASTPQWREGVMAFVEKRAPRFR
jgi:enoyl-CoA hydratase/carnithine racemase